MLDEHCELRRQIIEDVLGDSVEEYENFKREEVTKESGRQHRQRIPLWRFLLHLLNRDKTGKYIEWSADKQLEFRIKDTAGVASLWGSVKDKDDMTYEKLGRAMRYYYGKNVIEKVSGKRYSYQFILSRRTAKHLSQFMDVEKVKIEKKENIDHIPKVREPAVENNFSKSKVSPEVEKSCEILQPSEKIKPVKPLPKQIAVKTKIFKPSDLLVKTFHSFESNLITKNQFNLSEGESRRSAFVQPVKRKKEEELELYKKMPKLERISQYDPSPSLTKLKSYNKLYHERSTQRQSIMDDMSEADLKLPVSVSPQLIRRRINYSVLSSPNQDFILCKETKRGIVAKTEQGLIKLHEKLKTSRRMDPFMGVVDYLRYDDEQDRHGVYPFYDDLDEISYLQHQNYRYVEM